MFLPFPNQANPGTTGYQGICVKTLTMASTFVQHFQTFLCASVKISILFCVYVSATFSSELEPCLLQLAFRKIGKLAATLLFSKELSMGKQSPKPPLYWQLWLGMDKAKLRRLSLAMWCKFSNLLALKTGEVPLYSVATSPRGAYQVHSKSNHCRYWLDKMNFREVE